MFPRHWEDYTVNGVQWKILLPDVHVETLFAAKPELAALAVVLKTGNQMEFYCHDDVWRVLCASRDLLREMGNHFGDCTKAACSCLRCLAEMAYEDADEFQQDALPSGIDPLTLALATEDQCDSYAAVSKYLDEHNTFDGCEPLDTSVTARLAMWATLSDEQKGNADERAARYRAWLKDGLPSYPKNWPEEWGRD